MKFWRLTSPEYDEGDYSHTYINGDLAHPYSLPGVDCDVCGETWGGSRFLHCKCPAALRRFKEINASWPLSREQHAQLQLKVMKTLRIKGSPFVALRPGDTFQQAVLNIPSRPEADFLWSGIGTLVVSARIKRLIVCTCSRDIAVCPVTLGKVGRRSARLPTPIPESGEPEDMLNHVRRPRTTTGLGRYYEIVPRKESGYPPGGKPTRICSGCQRPTIGESRRLRMTSGMWEGGDIFYMKTTLYIIVTDELRERMEVIRPTNVRFEKV